jgi:hypothetical protein
MARGLFDECRAPTLLETSGSDNDHAATATATIAPFLNT